MLHEGARQVVADHGGALPTTVDGLLAIKGVGPYTAGAIASIAHGVAAPIVDGNVLRVLSRLCAIAASPKEPAFCADGKLAWALARQLVEADGGVTPGDLNQASPCIIIVVVVVSRINRRNEEEEKNSRFQN